MCTLIQSKVDYGVFECVNILYPVLSGAPCYWIDSWSVSLRNPSCGWDGYSSVSDLWYGLFDIFFPIHTLYYESWYFSSQYYTLRFNDFPISSDIRWFYGMDHRGGYILGRDHDLLPPSLILIRLSL